MNSFMKEFNWVGRQDSFIDKPNIFPFYHMVIGRYGGNSTAGQSKNEDGCLVWLNVKEDWEFVILLDAHNTSESAELIIDRFSIEKTRFNQILSLPTNHQTFKRVEEEMLNIFQSEEFLSACRKVTGETACLIVVRKGKYVWRFSVGDCVVFLFHQDLASLGQYQLNQRQFYEWIGQVNTFDQNVPCYSSGVKELRKGENYLFLTTDGLLECPKEPFENPEQIYDSLKKSNSNESISSMLNILKENNVRDSTTIVSWSIKIVEEATRPSK